MKTEPEKRFEEMINNMQEKGTHHFSEVSLHKCVLGYMYRHREDFFGKLESWQSPLLILGALPVFYQDEAGVLHVHTCIEEHVRLPIIIPPLKK